MRERRINDISLPMDGEFSPNPLNYLGSCGLLGGSSLANILSSGAVNRQLISSSGGKP